MRKRVEKRRKLRKQRRVFGDGSRWRVKDHGIDYKIVKEEKGKWKREEERLRK